MLQYFNNIINNNERALIQDHNNIIIGIVVKQKKFKLCICLIWFNSRIESNY